ncbi:MAG: ribonuclease P protein component [Lentisphaerae bacterium]|nr:ribonuclease P protein component [Lentisphaerota bacterium]
MNPRHKPDFRLRREQRLLRAGLFEETYAQRRNAVGRHMVMWLRKADDAGLRLGVVASLKVGGAVARNRAKRRLREAFRRHRHEFSAGVDVVLVARRGADRALWKEFEEELLRLAGQLGLMKK